MPGAFLRPTPKRRFGGTGQTGTITNRPATVKQFLPNTFHFPPEFLNTLDAEKYKSRQLEKSTYQGKKPKKILKNFRRGRDQTL